MAAGGTTTANQEASKAAKKQGGSRALMNDVPWRPKPSKPTGARVDTDPILRVDGGGGTAAYGLAVMAKADPIGEGFATEALLEAAGPECLVPGQRAGLRILPPISLNFKFLEPVGRQLQSLGKFMDAAVKVMNASFQDQ